MPKGVIPIRKKATARRLLALVLVLLPAAAAAQLKPCGRDGERIADALGRIKNSIDPCGQSAEVLEMLERVETCARTAYELCTDSAAVRNVFDRPVAHARQVPPRTITWNPELRTELEPACSGDLSQPLQRDPTASLLHELAHAAQDCDGLNPGEYELEAVRIENIYRRAAGLCERSGYGEIILPPSIARGCAVTSCSCSGSGGEPPPPLPLRQAESDSIPGFEGEGRGGEVSGDRPSLRSAHPRPDGETVRPRRDAASSAVGG